LWLRDSILKPWYPHFLLCCLSLKNS
jgi:hypothetical protein